MWVSGVVRYLSFCSVQNKNDFHESFDMSLFGGVLSESFPPSFNGFSRPPNDHTCPVSFPPSTPSVGTRNFSTGLTVLKTSSPRPLLDSISSLDTLLWPFRVS